MWKERLQKGSFRGVEFQFETNETEIGRRVAVHEYPLRDIPYIEDLGKKARVFSIEVYVIGNDYMTQRDALIEAIEKPGPGVLIHPTLGQVNASVQSARGPRESNREGGLASFSVTFIESGENKFPDSSVNTGFKVSDAASKVRGSFIDDITARYAVSSLPSFLTSEASTLLTDNLTFIKSNLLTSVGIDDVSSVLFESIDAAIDNVAVDVLNPLLVVDSYLNIIDNIEAAVTESREQYNVLMKISEFGIDIPAINETTDTRTKHQNNQASFLSFVQGGALSKAAEAAANIDFTHYDEAITIRDGIADQLDDLADTADDINVFHDLQDLRSAVVDDITTRGADLAKIVGFRPKATLPDLVIAHRLYGDARQFSIINDRNSVRHPSFITGGVELEVLNRAP